MSATLRSWMHRELQARALEAARQHFVSGPVSFLYSREPSGSPEYESSERLVIDPRRGAYRVEHEDSLNRKALHISDGETTWNPNASGAFIASSAEHRRIPGSACKLLDPSWLVVYEWNSYTPDQHNGRSVVRMRAGVSSSRVMQPRPDVQATDVEVLIDTQLGFLHRMTAFIDGQPYHLLELTDIVFDPILDPNAFRIDDSVRVIDEAELEKWRQPSLLWRVWNTLTWRFRRLARRSVPGRQRREPR
jgi:hypothetical protein